MSLDEIISQTTERLKKSYDILSSVYPKGSFTKKDLEKLESNPEQNIGEINYHELLNAALYSAQNGDLQRYGNYINATKMIAGHYLNEKQGQIQEKEAPIFMALPELISNVGLSFQYLNILQNSSNEIEVQQYLNQIVKETKQSIKSSYGYLERELLNIDSSKEITSETELKKLIETGDYSYFLGQAGNSAVVGDIEKYHINLGIAYQTLATKESLSEKEIKTIGAIEKLMLNAGISFEYIYENNSNKHQLKYANAA